MGLCPPLTVVNLATLVLAAEEDEEAEEEKAEEQMTSRSPRNIFHNSL